jgi:DNA-binding GntR family transcriptional regulator
VSHPRRKDRGRPKRSSEVSLASSRELDRNSDVPLYYQLGAALLEALETAPWREGARFPTERELEEQFKVSRVVVRRALELLEGDGAIIRRQGSGAFVAPRRRSVSVFGLVEALAGRRRQVSVEVSKAREEQPDAAVAKLLQLGGGEARVCHVTATLEVDGEPIALINSHTSVARLPWVLAVVQSNSKRARSLSDQGVTLTRSEVLIEHTFFSDWGGPKLRQNAGDPAWMIRLIQFGTTPGSDKEVPLEFARIFYPARRTKIGFTLKR